MARRVHLLGMSNHTIASRITTWAEVRSTDREVLNRAEVAALLTLDPRTVDQAIDDGTIPAVRIGRRVLIPRRPFLRTFGITNSMESDVEDRVRTRAAASNEAARE